MKKLIVSMWIVFATVWYVNAGNIEWVEAVNFMKNNNLSSIANSVEQYMPLSTVKREAASKFFDAFAEKKFNRTADTTKLCAFSDVNEANPVFVPYIKKACELGIINGVDGKALPKATLTKLQFITMLARVVKNNSNLTPVEAFNILKADGITNEATLANTQKLVSRIEVAILFKRAVTKYIPTNKNNNEGYDEAINIINELMK